MEALYRHFGHDGKLLYVGLTNEPPVRLRKHRQDKPWWLDVRNTTYEYFDTRPEVQEAERRAIRAEHPAWNVQHNNQQAKQPQPKRLRAVARLRPTSCTPCGTPMAAKYLREVVRDPDFQIDGQIRCPECARCCGFGIWIRAQAHRPDGVGVLARALHDRQLQDPRWNWPHYAFGYVYDGLLARAYSDTISAEHLMFVGYLEDAQQEFEKFSRGRGDSW
jgi:hypothetical protein